MPNLENGLEHMMSEAPRLPDFDVLVALYRHQPEAFEALRQRMLRQAVEVAPLSQRPALEELLDRIERERAAAATPLEAATKAMLMMQESVGKLHDAWEQAREAVAGLQATLIIERLRAEHRSL
ncbi:MAG TPA: DUF3135 domain-containing protein [Paucimonas sp.]|nr:DUF3135 domain-containing protein [Paucimonas sp.]